MPHKTRKLVVAGPRDSGKTSWCNVFHRIIPPECIASVTNEGQFSAAMITETTQLVIIDEWSSNRMQSNLAKTVLQGGWMVTSVKHGPPRCVKTIVHFILQLTTFLIFEKRTKVLNVEFAYSTRRLYQTLFLESIVGFSITQWTALSGLRKKYISIEILSVMKNFGTRIARTPSWHPWMVHPYGNDTKLIKLRKLTCNPCVRRKPRKLTSAPYIPDSQQRCVPGGLPGKEEIGDGFFTTLQRTTKERFLKESKTTTTMAILSLNKVIRPE